MTNPTEYPAVPLPQNVESDPQYMTVDMFQSGIIQLVSEGITYPYNIHPATYPGGDVPYVMTYKPNWDAYVYNPPMFLSHIEEYSQLDSTASSKPTFADIKAAYRRADMADLQKRSLYLLMLEEQKRISIVYGVTTIQDEILYRLRTSAVVLAPKDTERDRLHTKAKLLKVWIKDPVRTLAQLQSLDVSANSHWS